jgi:hypothetical protein
VAAKSDCKRAIQMELGLKLDADMPLMVFMSRLDKKCPTSLVCAAGPPRRRRTVPSPKGERLPVALP